MKLLFVITFLLLLNLPLLAQNDSASKDEVIIIVEKQPSPEGGFQSFYQYIGMNIKYPKEAIKRKIQGKVSLQFDVNIDGSLSNIKVLNPIGGGCDEEAIRLLENSPKWIPGEHKGKKVKVKMTLPIMFKLR